jgi:hypothetical protein
VEKVAEKTIDFAFAKMKAQVKESIQMVNEFMKALRVIGPPKAAYNRKSTQTKGLPTGPFRLAGQEASCSLLIFVPRNLSGAFINEMTGRYGYSHLAVDCGELDIPTGKRVMIEATTHNGSDVHYSFQDMYGERRFVRIPLEKTGVIADEFCNCIRSKLGEKFDHKEVITMGRLHDPTKQICSELAAQCLPEAIRTDMMGRYQAGSLHARSAARVYRDPDQTLRLFMSPNGFAEYFGAPKGEQLSGIDQLFEPVLFDM